MKGLSSSREGVIPNIRWVGFFLAVFLVGAEGRSAELDQFFRPPAELQGQTCNYSNLLGFENGAPLKTKSEWQRRRAEILHHWTNLLGPLPPLLQKPGLKILSSTNRENFIQHKVRVEISAGKFGDGYLLIPSGEQKRPAVVVPFYEPETSIGLGKPHRDFALQLARRGFVTLAIGSPGGDARKPDLGEAACQPLLYLAHVAANCAQALAQMPQVDANRIGVVGHSYGGKWALFAGAFYEQFACAAFSDPGIVFDETRPNVNYWEPWYLGLDPTASRKPGVPTEENPRTGPYKKLYESGRDLHEVLALYAPRPFFVSGGSEDPPERWHALNRVNEVYELLGVPRRIAMTNRPHHDPTAESNEFIFQFFERFLLD